MLEMRPFAQVHDTDLPMLACALLQVLLGPECIAPGRWQTLRRRMAASEAVSEVVAVKVKLAGVATMAVVMAVVMT